MIRDARSECTINFDDYFETRGYTKKDLSYIKEPIGMHDKYLLNDIKKAVALVQEANKIAVIGDYDFDGISATTIMVKTLQTIKKEVCYFIPNRFTDGYGLNINLIKKSIEEEVDLIITVDNGVSANAAIDFAKENNMKVIITDHHLFNKLPNADAIIHPALNNYPFCHISGCQVAYKLSQALLEAYNINDRRLNSFFLQLSAISIVSDVMPVFSQNMDVNENRGWLMEGLNAMNTFPQKSINALVLEAGFLRVDEAVLGFYFIPLINALGRLKDASIGVEFFLCEDVVQLKKMAKDIAHNNEERKKLVATCMSEEKPIYSDNKKAVFVLGKDINEGIIGIVAGKYAEGCVSFCFTEAHKDGQKVLKASGRNDTNLNLVEILDTVPKEYLVGYGGHKDACGVNVRPEYISEFMTHVSNYCDEKAVANEPYLLIVNHNQLPQIEKFVEHFKPFGNGLPQIKINVRLPFNSFMRTIKDFHKIETFINEQKVDAWIQGISDELENTLSQATNFIQRPKGTIIYNTFQSKANYVFEVDCSYDKNNPDKKIKYNCLEVYDLKLRNRYF